MWGGLEKSAHKFYAGQANPTRFWRIKCGAGQPALPPLVETLRYYSDICSETRTLLILLSCCISAFIRLVISSFSRPTSSSSSAPPFPRPVHPYSSSSSSSSSVSNSSTTEPLSVGAIQVLHPVEEVVRGEDPGGVVD